MFASLLTGEERRTAMAVTTVFTCLCGVQKKTTNHWVLASVTPAGITFMPWDWKLAQSEDIIVLCGEGCAAALLSRSFGDWKRASELAAVN
jgi:hypothetical protein